MLDFYDKEVDFMDYQALADLLFPDVTATPEELEARFPQRNLPEGAVVTRMAPSPTGFVHLGNLVQGMISERMAICGRCAILDGKPCRHPEKMHPCVESQGINIIPTLEENGLEFQYGQNVVTWVSLLLFHTGE